MTRAHTRRPCAGAAIKRAWVLIGSGLAAQAIATSEAHAGQCRELGGLGVAVGALVGSGVVLTTSFIGPALVDDEGGLAYWDGFGWTLLGGMLGVGAGTLLAATAACDQGPWLPSVTGFGGGLTALLVWSHGGPDPDAAGIGSASLGLSVGLSPRGDAFGLSFSGGF